MFDFFDVDEQNYLNSCAPGISRDDFLSRLNFTIMISQDEMVPFLSELKEKILRYTNEQWEKLQDDLPFMTAYDDSDSEEYINFLEEEEEEV